MSAPAARERCLRALPQPTRLQPKVKVEHTTQRLGSLSPHLRPPAPPPPAVVTETLDQAFSKNVRDVYFDYDKSDVRDDQKQTLADAASFLKTNSSVKFSIEGHCDERGSEEYNLGLGDRRANAVKNYLISLGIDAGRINPISYGKERPQCREATEDCYQKNRRGHFVMTGR